MGDEMPADPFREGQPDWSGIAANNHAFFMAHIAAGFSETHALELTSRYLNLVLSVIYTSQAGQQPEQSEQPGDQP